MHSARETEIPESFVLLSPRERLAKAASRLIFVKCLPRPLGLNIDMVSRSVGVQSSKECQEEVAAFYRCQREHGFVGRMCNACQTVRNIMDKCLDKEVMHGSIFRDYSQRKGEDGMQRRPKSEWFASIKEKQKSFNKIVASIVAHTLDNSSSSTNITTDHLQILLLH